MSYITVFDGLTTIKFPSAERTLSWLSSNGHGCSFTVLSWSGNCSVQVDISELALMDLNCVC